MSSYNIIDTAGHMASSDIAEHISKVLDIDPGEYSQDWILDQLKNEKNRLKKEFSAWKNVLEKLDAIASVNYYRGINLIKIFDVEKRIETDTDKARVNTYILKGEVIEKLLRVVNRKKDIIVKFISPRTIKELVSIWLFYEKALELVNRSIEFVSKCEGKIKIEN